MRATRTILSSASTQKLQQISRAAAQPRPNRQSHQPALPSSLHYLPRGSPSVTASFNSVRLADPPSASISEPRGSQLQPVAPRSSQPPDSGQKHQVPCYQKKKRPLLHRAPGTIVANTIVIRSDRVSAEKAPLRQRLGPGQRAGTRCSALTAGHQHAAGKNSSKQRIPRHESSRGGSAPPVSCGSRAAGRREPVPGTFWGLPACDISAAGLSNQHGRLSSNGCAGLPLHGTPGATQFRPPLFVAVHLLWAPGTCLSLPFGV